MRQLLPLVSATAPRRGVESVTRANVDPGIAAATAADARNVLKRAATPELAMTLPVESSRSTRNPPPPPVLPCERTESTIESPNLTFTTPVRVLPSLMTRASSTTVRCVAASAVACAVVVPLLQAVCHQPSSLCAKSDEGDVVTALYPYASVTMISAIASFGRSEARYCRA